MAPERMGLAASSISPHFRPILIVLRRALHGSYRVDTTARLVAYKVSTSRPIRTVSIVLLFTVIATACGSSSDQAVAERPTSATDTQSRGTPKASLRLDPDDPILLRASKLAVLAVDQLGSDDIAFEAVLRAGDAGYGARQIEAAIEAKTLSSDGSIGGTVPDNAASNLVEPRRSKMRAPRDPLPIEEYRINAMEQAGRDHDWPVGAQTTAMILQWQLGGYSQEEMVDMLILGVEVLDGDYEGEIPDSEEECGGYVIGGVFESPRFCDPDTGSLYEYDEDISLDSATEADTAASERAAGRENGCASEFAPPYLNTVVPSEAMMTTQILGPLETKYYYSAVDGTLEIFDDGSFVLMATTERLGEIKIRARMTSRCTPASSRPAARSISPRSPERSLEP